jgi:hypothetical protein
MESHGGVSGGVTWWSHMVESVVESLCGVTWWSNLVESCGGVTW